MPVSAQNSSITVNGRVTESGSGVPVPTANVVELGTSNGVMTDFDGEFSITVPPDAILEISYVGYATVEVLVNNRTELTISLSLEASALDEV